MKVVFLDIDGVIVTGSYITEMEKGPGPWRDKTGKPFFCPQCLKNVEILVQQTGAKVVLSSNWRFYLGDIAAVRAFFVRRKVSFDIYDITPMVEFMGGAISRPATRGEEINAWLEGHPRVSNYCILDDDPHILPTQKPYWIRTTWQYGFTKTKLEKALAILSRV
jgi:fatty-acid desaturase